MIVLIVVNKQCHKFSFSVFDHSAPMELELSEELDVASGQYVLPQSAGKMLDVLFRPNALLWWLSTEDMDTFLRAARRYLTYKVRRNSALVPDAVRNLLPAESVIHNDMLVAALQGAGLTCAEIYACRGQLVRGE